MSQSTTNRKPPTALYFLVTAMFWFSNYAYVPTMSPYLTSIGISYAAIGMIGGAYGLAQILLRIPVGITSDRIGRRKVFIIAGVFFGAVSSLGLYFATSSLMFWLLRFMAGMSASMWVVYTVLFASYFSGDKTASKIAYLNLAMTTGSFLARTSGSFAADIWGYRFPFLLSAGVGLIGVILSFFIAENAPVSASPPTVSGLLSVVRDKNLIVMAVIAVFSQMGLFATNQTFTPERAVLLGANTFQLGILATVSAFPLVVTSFICGRLYRRQVNLRMLIALAFIVQIVGTLMLAFAPNVTTVYIASLVAGFGFGFSYVSALSHCTLTVTPEKRGVAMGFFQAAYAIGMFAGPVVVGFIAQLAGLPTAIALLSVVAAAGFFTTLVALRK